MDDEVSNFFHGVIYGLTFGGSKLFLKQYLLVLVFDQTHKDLIDYASKHNSADMVSQLKGEYKSFHSRANSYSLLQYQRE